MKKVHPIPELERYLEIEDDLQRFYSYLKLKENKDRDDYNSIIELLLRIYGLFSIHNSLKKYDWDKREKIICYISKILLKKMEEMKEDIISQVDCLFNNINNCLSFYINEDNNGLD